MILGPNVARILINIKEPEKLRLSLQDSFGVNSIVLYFIIMNFFIFNL